MKILKQIYRWVMRRIGPCFYYIPFLNRKRFFRGVRVKAGHATLLMNSFNCKGHNNQFICENNASVRNCHIYIRGNNNRVFLGKNVRMSNVEMWIEDDNNSIRIMSDTSLVGKCHLACIEGTGIEIGENCMFSSQITMRTGDSHSITDRSTGERTNQSADIRIGNHTWIANSVTVLKGVRIADNCIVGTGAIVTKNIEEPYSLVAGVPAKVVKTGVDWLGKRI